MRRIVMLAGLGVALVLAALAFVVPADGQTTSVPRSAPSAALSAGTGGNAWTGSVSPFSELASQPGPQTVPTAAPSPSAAAAASAPALPVSTVAATVRTPNRTVIYATYLVVLLGAGAVLLWAALGGRRAAVDPGLGST